MAADLLTLMGYMWQIGAFLVAAGAVYGGIRNDLKRLHEKSDEAQKMAGKAHEKIDQHMIDHGRDRRHGG